MVNDIYFADNDGLLVTNRELARMAFIVSGKRIKADDFLAIREYAASCKGIHKEVRPSIKECLRNGDKVRAIAIYRDRHPGMGLIEARDIIEDMEKSLSIFK